MTAPRVLWIADLPPRPLCPVPWEGNTVVTSDGAVQLCCFSSAIVGNVRQHTFREIWNGATMQRIRQTLVGGVLPPECQTGSCPIFRGDDRHYLLDRSDGAFRRGGAARLQDLAAVALAGSRLVLPSRLRHGDRLQATLHIEHRGESAHADLFACLRTPSGDLRFLPTGDDVPQPFRQAIHVDGQKTVELVDAPIDDSYAAGDYEIGVALFLPDADPNLLDHCYWATSAGLQIEVRP